MEINRMQKNMYLEDFNPMARTLINVAVSLFITFLGFLAGFHFIPNKMAYSVSVGSSIFIIIATLILFLSFKNKQKVSFPMGIMYAYAFIEGLVLYPIVLTYAATLGVYVVINAFLGTVIWTFALGLIASKRKEKFLRLGSILFVGLLIELVAMIIMWFVYSDLAVVTISAFGLLIFSGYVLFDVSLLKTAIERGEIEKTNDLSIYVLNIYIDVVAIFLRVLRILSYFSKR